MSYDCREKCKKVFFFMTVYVYDCMVNYSERQYQRKNYIIQNPVMTWHAINCAKDIIMKSAKMKVFVTLRNYQIGTNSIKPFT